MIVQKVFLEHNPNTGVNCSVCDWRGMMKDGVAALDDVVRCPTCLEPVEVLTIYGVPVVWVEFLESTDVNLSNVPGRHQKDLDV